uniref:Uncharacterized protein n=1 Tax=Nicotiana tabacum TaxID=4097 RepID=A0A1S3Y2Y2_TOBAC|nr:PREDICTED: uncharacterized protein LOC107771598 [Nicotiana tabacum]
MLNIIFFSLFMKEARFHFGNRRSNIQPLSIKHLNLEIPFSWLLRYESLIDELFMYFHPKTLLVRVDSDASKNNFIQILRFLPQLQDKALIKLALGFNGLNESA